MDIPFVDHPAPMTWARWTSPPPHHVVWGGRDWYLKQGRDSTYYLPHPFNEDLEDKSRAVQLQLPCTPEDNVEIVDSPYLS